jgi:hypothetical protein
MGRLAREAGISAGTVVLFTKRVFTSIMAIKDVYVNWPDQREQDIISERFATDSGLPGADGVVDGTHIFYSQRPGVDGEAFFSCKMRYSMNVQLVCDDRRLIRYYQVGYPGSRYDSSIFYESNVMRNTDNFFSDGQFLLADAGYALGQHICSPYRQPAANLPENKLFNKLFSSARVVIERVNGILKGRFSSLRGLRTQIKNVDDLDKFCVHIVCCIVLYNMTLKLNDDWLDEFVDDYQHPPIPFLIAQPAGNNLRERVQNFILNWHRNNA